MAYISEKTIGYGKERYKPIDKDVVIERLKADSKNYPEFSKFPELSQKIYTGIVDLIYGTEFKYDITCLMNCSEAAIFGLTLKKMGDIGFAKSVRSKTGRKSADDHIMQLRDIRDYVGKKAGCSPSSIVSISKWIEGNVGEKIDDMILTSIIGKKKYNLPLDSGVVL